MGRCRLESEVDLMSRPEYIIGDIWEPSVTVVDSAGAVVDIAAYTCKWALKTNRGDTSYAASGMPVTGTCSSAGVATATVSATITAGVAAGSYWEEIEIALAGGSPRKQSFQRQVTVVAQVVV